MLQSLNDEASDPRLAWGFLFLLSDTRAAVALAKGLHPRTPR
jgi:hypothetical protein